MQLSSRVSDRILTTHTGSLPRPKHLLATLQARDGGVPVDEQKFGAQVDDAVREIVRKQREAGVDIVNDGEQGKMSYATYVRDRLTGFEGETLERPRPREADQFPDYWERQWAEMQKKPTLARPACNGPVTLRDPDAVHRDIATLKAAAPDGEVQLFMSAASPGIVSGYFGNVFYRSEDEFLYAVAEAMRPEYAAIAAAGIVLQVDCPDLTANRKSPRFENKTEEEYRRALEVSVDALNVGLQDVPPHMARMHVCWGNAAAPHVYDPPLITLINLLLQVRADGLSIEAANPRHAHEFTVFDEVKLPDGKYLIPGVIDSTTNFVEHPELIAQRILNFAERVGRENVVAGSDCGFATTASSDMVFPTVVWAKLKSMAEGAAKATDRLWTRAGSTKVG